MMHSTAVKYATFPRRLMAFNIDLTIFLLIVMPLVILIEEDWLFVLLLFLIICTYHAILESSSWGATLGKKYLGLQVVDGEGNRLTFAKALLRIITKYLSLLLFFVGFFMIYVRKDRKGLHDILSGTYVLDRADMNK